MFIQVFLTAAAVPIACQPEFHTPAYAGPAATCNLV